MVKQQFIMTQTQLERMLAAMKPEPYLIFGGMPPRSLQERANEVWESLGNAMGFEHMSVEPDPSGDPLKFLAVPKEVTNAG